MNDVTPNLRTPSDRSSRRRLSIAASAVLALGLIAGCGGSGDEPTSAAPSPTTETGQDTGTPEETTSAPAGDGEAAGCPATDVGTPEGADVVEVVDVDGDGAPDEAWLTGGADRTFGITTASGATFSVPVDSASPLPASAVVDVVGSDSTPIALVDTGRSVALYGLSGCAITVTENEQGEPYTFDKGFTGYGTGVGCIESDGALQLVGLDAVSDDDGETFRVSRTFVDLSRGGGLATNGETEVVAEGAGPNDPAVTTAQETSCGDYVAGQDGPVEPQ